MVFRISTNRRVSSVGAPLPTPLLARLPTPVLTPLLTLSLLPLLAACGQGGSAPDDGRPQAFAQCAVCHSVVPEGRGIGPSLAGAFGAQAGHVGDYAYSEAMRSSGLTWDENALNAYLENPQTTVPGTKMSYQGLKDAQARAEIIEYLKTL